MTAERQRWDSPPSEHLKEFMRQGWAPAAEPPLPPAPPAEVTARRRSALSRLLPGERLVIPAGLPRVRSNDTNYAFRPDSDYVWLSGDQSPGGVLILDPDGAAVLYARPPSGRADDSFWRDAEWGELWTGPRPGLDVLSAHLGIECRPLEELANGGEAAKPGELSDKARSVLAELRLVKDGWEVAQLREAIGVTADGFLAVARALAERPGAMTERDVDAVFGARARALGNGPGYLTIAAAGPHATVLHWTRNDGQVRQGELLLLDAGAETGTLYTADITRTLPVSGRYTAAQRDVYDIVLAAQKAAIAAIRPGRPFRDYHRASAAVLAEGLHGLGLLPVSAAESLREDRGLHRRWTLCAPGHMLGLDVHDCAQARQERYVDGTLEAGQVLTVEPGLYFQSGDTLVPRELRGLGIRIEDDVLVTANGCELLSGALPREPDAIEAWMAGA